MPDLTEKISGKMDMLGLDYTQEQLQSLSDYLNLLDKWNKAFNLTAVRNIQDMLERHLVDSLSIAAYIEGENLIDVGTGPGLPGIPLAILYPDKQFHLLDSNGKKTRFLQQSKLELGLDNIEVVNQRVEEFRPEQKFDAVLSRAFATLEDMIEGADHLCEPGGHFFAMKGVYPEMELQAVSKPYKVQAINWPGNELERHLVIISQA